MQRVEHSFNIEIATKYGIHIAILLKNIYFWISKNRANEKHYHEGKYWTYNSQKAFAELFPYLNERQVKYTLEKMKKDDLIIVGNFNENPYDKTCWYSLTEKALILLGENKKTAETPENIDETKLSNREDKTEYIDETKLSNRQDNFVSSYNDTDNKPYVKPIKKEEPQKKSQNSYEKIIDTYTDDPHLKETILEFIKMRKLKKNPPTDNALELIFKKLDKLSDSISGKIEILEQSIVNGYQGVFELKQDYKPQYGKQNKEPTGMDALKELADEWGVQLP